MTEIALIKLFSYDYKKKCNKVFLNQITIELRGSVKNKWEFLYIKQTDKLLLVWVVFSTYTETKKV